MNIMVEPTTGRAPSGTHSDMAMAWPMPASPRLVLLGRGRAGESLLPCWCDTCLAPPGGPRFFASRLWHETVLAHALLPDACPLLAVAGPVALPLLWEEGRLRSLVTPYSLEWQPLVRPGSGTPELRQAGQALAHLLRGRAPTRLDALDAGNPALEALLDGMRLGGLRLQRFRHFGNWRHRLDTGWERYLATRPPALRTTIQRKLGRAAREAVLTVDDAPGPGLERAIAAYAAVRARSWKPDEPFPAFDAALLRATATEGLMRIGVLWRGDVPMAAQYWVVGGGRASLLKLVHDEAARAASPGTALTAMMIRRLIEQDAVTELDFGRGDDPYKQLWASERHQRMGVILTDPWHPAGLVQLARQAVAEVGRRAMRIGADAVRALPGRTAAGAP